MSVVPVLLVFAEDVNLFTASACKISVLKSAHIHACRQYIGWSCNKSTFDTVHFYRNAFTYEGEKSFNVLDLVRLLVSFRVTARHAWQ